MEKTYKNNLLLICFIMILIHLAGLTYQIITKVSILAIFLKIFYIAMFILFLFTLLTKRKFSYLIGIISSCIIIIISSIYMDFLSVVVAFLIIYYSYKLKKYSNESYLELITEKKLTKNKKVIKQKRNK